MSAAAPAQRDLAGRKLGRYEVLAQLASGGMATVYVARAQGVAGFERLVAIKVLHPHLAHDEEFISMFLDEARLAARIRHPNVVPTLDISEDPGDGYYLVMEYIEGDHFGALLREAAKAGKRLPPAASVRIVTDALEGLSAAHTLKDGDGKALSIVHRDVSPHNILLGSDGISRITDFGVAKAEVRLSSTRDGQFKGKLSYMAPEQASTGFADQRSDLFSMGIVLWESLTARRLFRADNNGELLNRVLNAQIPNPSEVDPALVPLDAVLQKALDRDPEKRFQSAAEFVDALENAQGTSGIAPTRIVSRVVKEWLGPKIETEHARIKTAIDTLGRSDISSPGRPKLELPASASTSQVGAMTPTPSAIRAIPPEDMTVGAKPSTLEEAPKATSGSNRNVVIGIVVLVALLGIGGGIVAVTSTGSTPPAATTPAAAPPVVTAPVAPPVAPVEAAVVAPEPPAGLDPPPIVEEVEGEVETEVAAPSGSSGGRRRRPRGGSSGSSTTTETTPPASSGGTVTTPPPAGSDDDDVVINPYRN